METLFKKLTAEQAERIADSMMQEVMHFEEVKEQEDCIDDYCGHYWIAGWRFAVSMNTETEREFQAIRKQLQKAIEREMGIAGFRVSF